MIQIGFLQGWLRLKNLYDWNNHLNPQNFIKEISKTITPFNSNPKGAWEEILIGIGCILDEWDELIKFFKTFKSFFSWKYYDLEEFRRDIFQHIIPLKENSKYFKQKLRHFNIEIEVMIKN